MRKYTFLCEDHGNFNLEVNTIGEFEEITTSSTNGSLLPCPECEELCNQDWSKKKIVGIVKDNGAPWQGGRERGWGNRRQVEEDWMRKECEVTKEAIRSNEAGQASPYSNMNVNYDYYRNKYGNKAIADEKTIKSRDKNIDSLNSKHRSKVGDQVSKSK